MLEEWTLALLLLVCALFVIAKLRRRGVTRRESRSSEPSVGGLYSVRGDDGFGVVKLLVLDDADIFHIRLYKNQFASRPLEVDPATLTLGTIEDSDGFGVGHLPMSRKGFFEWEPALIQRGTVSDEELEGYELWREYS